jgi:signal transduction histidine kinase
MDPLSDVDKLVISV